MPYIGASPNTAIDQKDLNGQKLILDADADTSITADTDDTIHIEIAGADDFTFTANTFTVLSGSTLAIASGATIANSGTATGFSNPASANGAALGSASLEWSDLYLAESGVIYFGADQDVTVTHDPDDGLFLKSIATADNNPVLLTLQTGETDIAADDVIGKIAFQAPDEGTGTDAILVSAAIQARAEGNFSSSNNATSLDFMLGVSEAATTKMSLSSVGNLTLTSTDAGTGDGPILDLYRNSASPADGDDIGAIRFSGENNAGTKDTLAGIRVDMDNVVDGAEDVTMRFSIFQNGSSVDALGITASSNTTQVQLGHVGSVAQPSLTFTSDLDTGIYSVSGGDRLGFACGGTSGLELSNSLLLQHDTSNALMTKGFTTNQESSDNEIFALKSSDVAHAMTDYGETDTYFSIAKARAANGGAVINSILEAGGPAEGVFVVQTLGNPGLTATKLTQNWNSGIELRYFGHDGSNGIVDVDANGNVFAIKVSKASGTKFIFGIDEDGDIFQDGTTNNAFDAWDDAALLRSLQLQQTEDHKGRNTLALKDQVIKSRFDTNRYTKEHLEKAKLIQVASDEEWNGGERSLLNETVRGYVQTGAIWQNHEMIDALMEAMEAAMKDAGVNDFQKDYVKPRFVERGLPTQILDWTGTIPDDVTVPDIAPTAFNS